MQDPTLAATAVVSVIAAVATEATELVSGRKPKAEHLSTDTEAATARPSSPRSRERLDVALV